MDSRTLRVGLAVAGLVGLAGEAQAFDCTKASSKFEKAICANASARAADEAMSKAFSELTAGVDARQRQQITGGQIAWIQQRNDVCEQAGLAGLGACLATESDKRRAFLSGSPEQGPGAASKIIPWFKFEKGSKTKAAVDMELLRFADPKTPGERAFNDATTKFLTDIIQPEKDDPGSDHYAFGTNMRLVYASPKLISAQADSFADNGGAHPNSDLSNINLDIAAGGIARFQDVFEPKSAEKVFDICLDQVKAAKKERLGDDSPLSDDDLKDLVKNVRDSTSDLGAWSFETTKAVVTYNNYAVGSYAEGRYECTIGYDRLRPLVKTSFPLP